jgi:hypothetical protein
MDPVIFPFMDLILTLLGYAGIAALIAVSLGGFAASVACAVALFVGKHG